MIYSIKMEIVITNVSLIVLQQFLLSSGNLMVSSQANTDDASLNPS